MGELEMTTIRSILAATDFSTDGRHAAERAAMICATAGVPRGEVLHVIESGWLDALRRFIDLPARVPQSLVTNATQSLKELVATVREHAGIDLAPRVRVGRVLDAMLEALADFDLLALGARGLHPVRDLTIGTTCQRLLSRTSKSVLVVRRKPAAPYRRILVAVDFSAPSRSAYALAGAIAPEGELYLVHVFEATFEGRMRLAGVTDEIIEEYCVKARRAAEIEMEQFIAGSGIDGDRLHRFIEHGGHVSAKLLEMAREIGVDLVVVGKHGKSLVERLLLGSVTLHLLAESSCDVLVTG